MELINSINIQGTLLDYFSDNSALDVLSLSRSSTQFTSYSVDSLRNLGSFWIDKKLTNYTYYIEEDLLYICLGNGELVAIDTFSGMEMVLFDLGSMVPLGVVQGSKEFFVLCGVIINNNKSINTDMCICVCDKTTGEKKFQSQVIKGNFLPMVCDSDAWVVANNHLSCSFSVFF